METTINKPRVFLSHSQKNSKFIEKLDNDLRRCQIDTWLFTVDIRHGKSWQDSIFEFGIPACDVVIVYLTEASIESSVVKKEIDVAILQNLSDNNIAFLPYVVDAKLRSKLRPDLQALQVPEWNDDNYHSLLPRVVAEIWRSFLEKTISVAIKSERLKRVEAELELEKYKNQDDDAFSKSEQKEFEFIWQTFDRTEIFSMGVYPYNDESDKRPTTIHKFVLDISSAISSLSDHISITEYNESLFRRNIYAAALELIDGDDLETYEVEPKIPRFREELLMLGLVEKYTYTTNIDGSEYLEHKFELTKKYFRYKFWLAYHQKLADGIKVRLEIDS